MRDYLIFQLYGPLASWGEIAVGESRHTGIAPSKSAVLGLLAAALGLRRPDTARDAASAAQWEREHQALAEAYGMAVKLTQAGLPLTDFHTAEVPKGSGFATRRDEILAVREQKLSGTKFSGTILSRRDYRQDAYAAVALWARDGAPYTLSALRDTLLEPGFALYLGRKSCPLALPLNPAIRAAEGFEHALHDLGFAQAIHAIFEPDAWLAEWHTKHLPEKETMFLWDADAETGIEMQSCFTRRDHPVSRQRWQFAVREERRAHSPGA